MPLPLVAGIVALLAVAQPGALHGSGLELTAQERQVVLAALDATAFAEARRILPRPKAGVPLAVVPDATLVSCGAHARVSCIAETSVAGFVRLLGGAGSPLAAAFEARLTRGSAVREVGERILVVSASELDAAFAVGPRWEGFNKRFGPTALVKFSGPAIEGNEAAVYVQFGCGGLCGKTWLVTLERRDGAYRVRKSHLLTIS